jgi:hypothetical protein
MRAPIRITAQATLFLAAWIVVASGLRAEDFSMGRLPLPEATPAGQTSNTVPPGAGANHALPTVSAERSSDFVAAPRRQPGVFATADEERLDGQRGMADTHIETTNNTNNATANLGNNTASNLTTGNNVIRDGSFGNSSGIPMVIQNSGNNVVIQNSTILHLRLQ